MAVFGIHIRTDGPLDDIAEHVPYTTVSGATTWTGTYPWAASTLYYIGITEINVNGTQSDGAAWITLTIDASGHPISTRPLNVTDVTATQVTTTTVRAQWHYEPTAELNWPAQFNVYEADYVGGPVSLLDTVDYVPTAQVFSVVVTPTNSQGVILIEAENDDGLTSTRRRAAAYNLDSTAPTGSTYGWVA